MIDIVKPDAVPQAAPATKQAIAVDCRIKRGCRFDWGGGVEGAD